MEMHTLTFSDLEWAVILNTYSTDEAVAEIVRSHAQARAHAASELSNPSSNKNIENTNESAWRGVKGGVQTASADGTFIPPDIEAVKAYFKTKSVPESEGEAFWNYWEARGWIIGKKWGKMKNWHCSAATWIRNIPQYSAQPKPTRPQPATRRPDNYLPPTEEERKRNASLF